MLDVTIDLVPYGAEEGRKTIGRVSIVNDGSGDDEYGIYEVTFSDDVRVRVQHRRASDVYKLLLLALAEREKKQNS